MRSLMILALLFVMVNGAREVNFELDEQELEELRRECGPRHAISGLLPVKTSIRKTGVGEVGMYATGIAISKRHLIVHARSLFSEWECHDPAVRTILGDKKRYQVDRELCNGQNTEECKFATPHRVLFQKAFDRPCKDEKNVGSRVHGIILIEMNSNFDFHITKPICLPPVKFDPSETLNTEHNVVFTESNTISETENDQHLLKKCDDKVCVNNAAKSFGRIFLHNRKNRNFFIGYHPTLEEGEKIHGGQGWLLDYLLMSNHAELIYQFTKIPVWNYTADMFPEPPPTTTLPPPNTPPSRITGSSPTSPPDGTSSDIASLNGRMMKSEEFALIDYDADDLTIYRHLAKGGGVNGATWISMWISTWWLLIFCRFN